MVKVTVAVQDGEYREELSAEHVEAAFAFSAAHRLLTTLAEGQGAAQDARAAAARASVAAEDSTAAGDEAAQR